MNNSDIRGLLNNAIGTTTKASELIGYILDKTPKINTRENERASFEEELPLESSNNEFIRDTLSSAIETAEKATELSTKILTKKRKVIPPENVNLETPSSSLLSEQLSNYRDIINNTIKTARETTVKGSDVANTILSRQPQTNDSSNLQNNQSLQNLINATPYPPLPPKKPLRVNNNNTDNETERQRLLAETERLQREREEEVERLRRQKQREEDDRLQEERLANARKLAEQEELRKEQEEAIEAERLRKEEAATRRQEEEDARLRKEAAERLSRQKPPVEEKEEANEQENVTPNALKPEKILEADLDSLLNSVGATQGLHAQIAPENIIKGGGNADKNKQIQKYLSKIKKYTGSKTGGMGKKTLNNRLDDLEEDVVNNLNLLGSPFVERAKKAFEIMKITANTDYPGAIPIEYNEKSQSILRKKALSKIAGTNKEREYNKLKQEIDDLVRVNDQDNNEFTVSDLNDIDVMTEYCQKEAESGLINADDWRRKVCNLIEQQFAILDDTIRSINIKLTAEEKRELLNQNYDPADARHIYKHFEDEIDGLRDEMNQHRDDEKKLLSKFVQLMSLIQDINPSQRNRVLNELNNKIKSAHIPVKLNIDESKSREAKTVGGAPEAIAVDSKGPPGENPLEKIRDIRNKLGIVEKWVLNEIKSNYDQYDRVVFKEVYATPKCEDSKTTKAVANAETEENAPTECKLPKTGLGPNYQEITAAKDWKVNIDQNTGKVPTGETDDGAKATKLFDSFVDEKTQQPKWISGVITTKIPAKRKELEDIQKMLLELCELPVIKNLPLNPKSNFKNRVKDVFSGDNISGGIDKFEPKTTTKTYSYSFGDSIGILDRLENIRKNLETRFQETFSILSPLANQYKTALQRASEKGKYPGYGAPPPPGYRGIDPLTGRPYVGGSGASTAYSLDDTGVGNDIVKFNIQGMMEKISDLKDLITDIEKEFKKASSSSFSAAVTSGAQGTYGEILNRYKSDSYSYGPIIATEKMDESLKANKLLPKDVLKLTRTDRFLFAVLTLFLRSIAIMITEYFIKNGTLQNIVRSLTVFVVIYSALFLLTVFYVNMDAYRLRIIFNYINLNANAGSIGMHIMLLFIVTYGVYLIISYLNFPIKGIKNNAYSDEDKAYLMYQFEIITMVIWLFLLLLIMVM